MGWTFNSYSSDYVEDVVPQITTGLQALNSAQSATAKTALSDQHSSTAHGVVIYNSNMEIAPVDNLTGAWQDKTWSFDSDDEYAQYYQEVCDMLNGVGDITLTETQAAYAHFSMSKYHTGYTWMALFWQNT